jgi:biopolymer transport protein ExbD
VIRTPARREELLINMTPMIDVMIFLIVFFLAATKFSEIEREQDVQLPEAGKVGSLSGMLGDRVMVNVKKDGAVFIDGRSYAVPELKAMVQRRVEVQKGNLKVEVRADRRTLHGDVARVLAALREAGVSRPAIDTKQETLEP